MTSPLLRCTSDRYACTSDIPLSFSLFTTFDYPSLDIAIMPNVTVNNHEIAYADTYPNGAPTGGLTFVFIHGLGSSQNYYYPILPYLDDHRCIALDTYGAARSTYTGGTISIASIAADVVAVLDALRVSKAVAVGHSMGGLVATLLGAQYADRVHGVVAIGPTHPSEGLAKVMTQRSELVATGK